MLLVVEFEIRFGWRRLATVTRARGEAEGEEEDEEDDDNIGDDADTAQTWRPSSRVCY